MSNTYGYFNAVIGENESSIRRCEFYAGLTDRQWSVSKRGNDMDISK